MSERGGRRRFRGASAAGVVVTVTGLWVWALVLSAQDGGLLGALTGIGTVMFAIVGAVVAWQRPANRLGPLMCIGSLMSSVLGVGSVYATHALIHAPGSLPDGKFVAWLADQAALPMVALFAGVIPQLFPDGRALSRRWRIALIAAVAFGALGAIGNAFIPQQLESVSTLDNPYAIQSAKPLFSVLIALSAPLGLVAAFGTVATLVLRWRRSHGDERQQLKWFLAGMVPLLAAVALHQGAPAVSNLLFAAGFVALPASLGVAILRYRLYELDLVIRRTVVYTAVTAAVAGIYLAVVAVVETSVGRSPNLGEHVVAAVAAAAAFQPLRVTVQRVVDRTFYGDRARPYQAVRTLGRRLEQAILPETVLPAVVSAVAETLRVPYVAIELNDGDGWTVTAEHGRRAAPPEAFAMTYQSETVGRMLVSPRSGSEALDDADRQLLADLARHAGVAAHAVRTTAALQRSRAELVAAREEERRRLRRDLHDGLGPTLAGVTLGLHAARARTRTDPEEADRLLVGLAAQVEQAVADVRRLVYGLRPPALDEFGLVRALQMHVTQLESGADGLRVAIDTPAEGLARLPAAVEVAAYRIVTEALTNVARHAHASSCVVRLGLNGALDIDVHDDGCGLPAQHRAGVGLSAMRERAIELGGSLTVTSNGEGTCVRARLPVLEPS